MKKIMFLVDRYNPSPSNNGNCVNKIIESFNSSKIQSYVISYTQDSLEKSHTYVVNIPDKSDYNNILSKIKLVFTMSGSNKNIKNYYKESCDMIEKNKIDTVICVYRPTETIYAGIKIKKKYPNIRLISYFLDSANDIAPQNKVKNMIIKHNSYKMQKKIFSYSDEVYIIDSYANIFKKECFSEFKGKMKYLPIPLFHKSRLRVEPKTVFDEKKINIVYVGSLDKDFRNPGLILEKLLYISKSIENIVIHFYGIGCEDILVDYQKKMPKNIIINGSVSKERANIAVRNADILLNISNALQTQVPGKIFEYFAEGKPILNYINIKNDPAISYYDKYPKIFNINSWDTLVDYDLLKEFILNSKGKLLKYDDLLKIYYKNNPSYTANIIYKDIN